MSGIMTIKMISFSLKQCTCALNMRIQLLLLRLFPASTIILFELDLVFALQRLFVVAKSFH